MNFSDYSNDSIINHDMSTTTRMISILVGGSLKFIMISLAANVSTLFCRYLFNGLAPYIGSYPLSATKIFAAGVSSTASSLSLRRLFRSIMNALLEHRGKVVEREKLMQQLWNTDEFVTDASLTVLVSRLRSKLRDISGGKEIIGTKKGRGYYIL